MIADQNNTMSASAETKIENLLGLCSNPLKLIREGQKFGITAVKTFISIMLLFAGLNLLMLVIGIYRVATGDVNFENIMLLLTVLLLGIGMSMYAAYRTYKFVLFDTLRVIYKNLGPMMRSICAKLVDKAAGIYYRKAEFRDNKIENLVDVDVILTELYGRVPVIVQNGIIRLLNRVPFLSMVNALRVDILEGRKESASETLYLQMDEFITENVFSRNNTSWVIWLIGVNMIIQLLIVFYAIA
jgi:hypothetical protein